MKDEYKVELIFIPKEDVDYDKEWQQLADFLGKMILTHFHELGLETEEKD